MKIRWILPAAAGIVALAGAQTGQQTARPSRRWYGPWSLRTFADVPVKEIVNRLNDRDIQLVERPYSAQYVETAQGIVEELMAEKGHPGRTSSRR